MALRHAGAQDAESAGVKNIGAFLAELTDRAPSVVLANVAVLLPHLDGEA